jgi:L-lactate dehydrogenase complex protein LldG
MSSSSRDLVLGRIRRALADVPSTERPEQVDVPRDYLPAHAGPDPSELRELLAENLADYRAVVHRAADESELPALVARILTDRRTASLAVPPGLSAAWLSELGSSVEQLHDGGSTDPLASTLTATRLDTVDSVITGCAVAIAETGTIVLDAGPAQGRRLLTLVPDHHLCVVRAEQIVASVGQGLPRLEPSRPLTWISGPSATSDIEFDRVEGVHGPRTLEVIVLDA